MTIAYRSFAASLAFIAGLIAFNAAAQTAAGKMPTAIVAVIDNQRISRDAAAFKAARQQADQYRSTYQQEFSKEEERLRQEEQELERQRTLLAPEAFETKRREFQTKVAAYQRRVQERNRALDLFIRNTQTEVQKVLNDIVRELANERGFTVLLDRGLTFYAADPLNVTDEVLKRVDKRMPVAKVPPPGASQ